jgi:hypothetical protein
VNAFIIFWISSLILRKDRTSDHFSRENELKKSLLDDIKTKWYGRHKRVLEWLPPGTKKIGRERRICYGLEVGQWTNTEDWRVEIERPQRR